MSHGTLHNPGVRAPKRVCPRRPAGTLAVTGDLKTMRHRWLEGASFTGYGVTLTLGLGIPIPILDEETMEFAAVTGTDITAPVVNYSEAYPNGKPEILGEVSVAQLQTGEISLTDKKVVTAGLSASARARDVALNPKSWIEAGTLFLTDPVAPLPAADSRYKFKLLPERPGEGLQDSPLFPALRRSPAFP